VQSESDLDRLLVHHLTASDEVMALLGGEARVFTSHGRDSEEATRVGPALILEWGSGPVRRSAPLSRRTLHTYGYSRVSQAEAVRLHEAARAVLQAEGLTAPRTAGGEPAFSLRAVLFEDQAPIRGWNTDVAAWFTRGTWTVHVVG
jgi:hypothetical protein